MSVFTTTKENFDQQVLSSEQPVLVDFWAPWCGYCRRISPAVDQLANEHESRVGIGKVNIDEQPTLAERFEVETIPTLILFKKGETIGEPLIAPTSKAQINDWLKENGAL